MSHTLEPEETPAGWAQALESLAVESGLALLLVAGHQPPSLAAANNNSICHAFQSSPTHAHLCEPYCGVAYKRAWDAGAPAHYRCHAGLHCVTMPVETDERTRHQLAVIGGRAFLRSADYRALAERLRTGELSELLSSDLFRNVIFASKQDLDELAKHVEEAATELRGNVEGDDGGEEGRGAKKPTSETRVGASRAKDPGKVSLIGRAPADYFSSDISLQDACSRAVPSLVEIHGIESVALMLRQEDAFAPYCVTGRFVNHPPRISLKAKELKLLQSARQGESITVPASGRTSTSRQDFVELFPMIIGHEIKGMVVVGDAILSDAQRRAVLAFTREAVLPLEVLRLREELERRMRAATNLQAFTERINSLEPDEAYTTILRHSAELLHAERGSLLLFDERANELAVKAAVGPRAEIARDAPRMRLGDGVAGSVLREGRPLVVSDMAVAGHHPAPAERSYKTSSFISYPIIVGGRKVGVLNVTDKAGGGVYNEMDLGLLEMIAPQMALALDRAEWHQKATQFQLLSITDPLTGLLNRRYMEERLSEELERSKRHPSPMSFMMIDIDDFKSYNDRHGHQAGDLALEMTAQCLKSALRSADVASRYGGEEFSILLPQTNLSEAHVIAERIRRRVERTHYPHGKTQPLGAVTVSIGISAFSPNLDTPASIIYAADQALYSAKSRGKNCVDSFSPNAPDSPVAPSDANRKAK
ncbi:MAG TPA: diguanylate cyclase [Pyrinomonadaceae bacterium]